MRTISFDFDNVGGITRVYAIPPSAVRHIRPNPLTGYFRLALRSTDEVVELPVYSQAATLFDEVQSSDSGMDTYEVSLSVLIPRQNDPLLLHRLERGSWLVLHQDANGDLWLSGTPEIPLRFTSSRHAGGEDVSGNTGTFTATEPRKSYHIDPRAFFL